MLDGNAIRSVLIVASPFLGAVGMVSIATAISPVRHPDHILVQFSFQFLIGSFVSRPFRGV